MPMQCQEEYLPGPILQKDVMQCWFLPVLCQSQGINNCYNHCLSTFVNPWFILINWWIMVPTTLWFWLIFYIHLWHGICFRNLSSTRLPRPMSTQGRGWIPGARHYPLVNVSMSGCQYLLEFCWWFWLVILIDSPISIHFHRDFHGFPKISRRSPEVGHAVFPDGTQIKQRALLVEFNRDCTLKVMWVYKFIWVITCFNVFINPL